MHRALRYGLVAVVAVALLSVGANALVERGPSGQNTPACASAQLSVFPDRDDGGGEAVAYADLSDSVRRAVDRARNQSNRTATLDPDLLDDLPTAVAIDDTRYEVRAQASGCPVVAGLPRWTNLLIFPFLGIYWVLSPLYLPGAVVLGIAVGFHYVGDRLRFG